MWTGNWTQHNSPGNGQVFIFGIVGGKGRYDKRFKRRVGDCIHRSEGFLTGIVVGLEALIKGGVIRYTNPIPTQKAKVTKYMTDGYNGLQIFLSLYS